MTPGTISLPSFNEAAALPAAEVAQRVACLLNRKHASMRPRHYLPRKYTAPAAAIGVNTGASMRPRHYLPRKFAAKAREEINAVKLQ